jgi:hypothetical protein
MKIKDIRQYRSIYKSTRPVSKELDEHYIGNFYDDTLLNERKYGWFTLYHGDKDGYGTPQDGIANFLQSFLDMAKDGQAVYEFLQNAVDAGSSHFTMAWGQDDIDGHHYLLVANNGKMFDFNSVRSILNVGSSTKTADSKSIGKFGIGFKLAHRLVGKDNGLDELLHHNPSGPILFSWKQHEITQLAKGLDPQPSKITFKSDASNSYKMDGEEPWLFKILLTCFPCLPENSYLNEEVKLVNGIPSETALFSKEEYKVLSRWVAKYSDILNKDYYTEGSLFFIKLGSGKDNDLADNNLAEGIKFSLAILQETAENKDKLKTSLQTVQLNREEPIIRPDLNYLYFNISKETDLESYTYIRFGERDFNKLTQEQKNIVSREDDIEVLFGFRNYDRIGEYFKGAPNFYLYFPLSEEVHNFNFILHSNAFYKASSRTFLHKGTVGEDGINERLLRNVASRLKAELEKLYTSDVLADNKTFLHLYAALLTSSESNNNDRKWIKEPFIDEVTNTLKSCIPIRTSKSQAGYQIATNISTVYFKTTAIEIHASWGLSDITWFYWGEESSYSIRDSAQNKLKLKSFNIYELLQYKSIYVHINTWLQEDRDRAKIILRELNILSDRSKVTENFKENLSYLSLFYFTDGKLLCINDINKVQHAGYIILHNKLFTVRNELLKCGFKISELDLDSYQFYQNFNSYLSMDSQLRSQDILIEIFSNHISNDIASRLSKGEKLNIFRVFRDMIEEGKRITRLKEFKLFTNELGQAVAFKNLLNRTDRYWLKPYVINANESDTELERYLLSHDVDVYGGVIYPFWNTIALNVAKAATSDSFMILDEITDYYKKTTYFQNEEQLLSEKELLFFDEGILSTTHTYFHKGLNQISEDLYNELQVTLSEKLEVKVPDRKYLGYYLNVPFRFEKKQDIFQFNELICYANEISIILHFCKACSIDIFQIGTIYKSGSGTFKLAIGDSTKNYYTSQEKIRTYIETFLDLEFSLLPKELIFFEGLLTYRSVVLSEYLIEKADVKNRIQLTDLTESLLNEDIDVLVDLLDKHETIEFDTSWFDSRHNEIYLRFLGRLLQNGTQYLDEIHQKVVLKNDRSIFELKHIDEANDAITIPYGKKSIVLSRTAILELSDETGIKQTRDFAAEIIKRELLNLADTYRIFKITESGISDTLIEKLLDLIPDKKIQNCHQLALVILSNEFRQETLSDYKVLSADGAWNVLEGNWLVPESNSSLFNSAYVLSNKYSGIQELLQFSDLEVFPFYSEQEDGTKELNVDCFYSSFLFQIGCSPFVFSEDCNKEELFRYLYLCWKKTSPEKRINFIRDEWQAILGFEPSKKIADSIIIKDEMLDGYILDFLADNTSSKTKFLKAFGIHNEKSKVVQLRQWLLSDNVETLTVDINQISNYLLGNTLIGLAEGFANQKEATFKFGVNDKKYVVIIKILQKILDDGTLLNYRLPVYITKDLLTLGEETNKMPNFMKKEDLELLLEEGKESLINHLFEQVPIALHLNFYDDSVTQYYNELNLKFNFAKAYSSTEHDEPFYLSWSENYLNKLYKCDAISFYTTLEHEEKVYELGTLKKDRYYISIDEDEDLAEIYYLKSLSMENLQELLQDEGYEVLSDQLTKLIESRNKTLASFYHAISASGKEGFDDEDVRMLRESLNKRNIEDRRNEIIEEIKNEDKYSYNWFIKYLEYLQSFDQIVETTSQRSISFQKIEAYEVNGLSSSRYFMIKGASSVIPANIEIFEDFSISLIFSDNSREEIIVEGVNKRGQDLLIYIPQGLDPNIILKFVKVVSIKINFSPVLNLIKRLFTSFKNEDVIEPWDDIQLSLPPIHFIYGPPGTGKTTTLCTILEDAYLKNPNLKALVLTPTNKAGDVLAKRILTGHSSNAVIKIGNATDPDLEYLQEDVYQARLDDIHLDSSNVIISTIHRLPYYRISSEQNSAFTLYSDGIKWDYILFDEASMISLPYLVFALQSLKLKNPDAKIIIAGDPKQIPPVIDTTDKHLDKLEVADENIYKVFGIYSFDAKNQVLRKGDSIENLSVQYRSVETIGRLFSTFSYSNLLKHNRDLINRPIKILPDEFIHELKEPVTLIDFPINSDNSVLTPKKLLYSSYHIYAGILVAEILKHLDKTNVDQNKYTIGVVSPYKAQALLMNKLITSFSISNKLTIHCDTVHGFQGDECDIIIFVVNPNNTYYTAHVNSLLSKEYIYNVAISRAKDHLWILNPYSDISNPRMDIMKSILNRFKPTQLVSYKVIEKYIFDKSDFIESNSYVTGHDSINVFGQIDMKYFIKAGDTAIDIQLRK